MEIFALKARGKLRTFVIPVRIFPSGGDVAGLAAQPRRHGESYEGYAACYLWAWCQHSLKFKQYQDCADKRPIM